MEMTIIDAAKARHTVRRYRNEPLAAVDLVKMNLKIAEINRNHNLQIRLLVDVNVPVNWVMKLFMTKGLRNYIILSGPSSPSVKETLGYVGAEIMLYAQTIGLNTWWVGGSYDRRQVWRLAPGHVVAGIIVFGYGLNQGHPHRTRLPHEVSSYVGKMPTWFKEGVKLALLAPTPYNKQNFLITGRDNEVEFYCDDGRWGDTVKGIIRYYFEIGSQHP